VLAAGMNERAGYLILEVRRSNLVHDTMRGLANKSSADYKKPLKVHFVGEKGIDAGGLRKEFFQLIIAELFDARYGMFLVNEETSVQQQGRAGKGRKGQGREMQGSFAALLAGPLPLERRCPRALNPA
jgi:hypothetical protein